MVKTESVMKLVLFIMVATILVSCSSANEDEMKKKQLEVRSELEGSIADVERAIDRVKNDLASAGEKTRESLNTKIDRLEDARKDLRDKLDEVGDTTADQWDEFRRSVSRAVDNAKHTLQDV